MNEETYMLFDSASEEWRETTMEEIAQLNDPDLQVCVYTTAFSLLQKNKAINVTVAPVKEEVAVIMPAKNAFDYVHSVTSRVLIYLFVFLWCWAFIGGGFFLLSKKLIVPAIIVFVLFFALPPVICSKQLRERIKRKFK